jgi:hypothetical protein
MMGNEAAEDFNGFITDPFFQIAVKNTYNQGCALQLVLRMSPLFQCEHSDYGENVQAIQVTFGSRLSGFSGISAGYPMMRGAIIR